VDKLSPTGKFSTTSGLGRRRRRSSTCLLAWRG
jgi:hypothetical protein